MASTWLSIAVGAGGGAVNGWTLTSGGSVDSTMFMQLVVIDSVALGFMRRMLIVEVAIVKQLILINVRVDESWASSITFASSISVIVYVVNLNA